jgi:hypothetical protein
MYARDPMSKAVINTDDGYYKSIVARRNDMKKNYALEQEIHNLKDELISIKTLLQQVISGKNHD